VQLEIVTQSPLSDTDSLDAALERLRRDLSDAASKEAEDVVGAELIDDSALKFEVERMRMRLTVWEIFMTHIEKGARTWPEVQRSLTQEDCNEIVRICDGVPLRDLLLDLR
jgi:hypothetical protein